MVKEFLKDICDEKGITCEELSFGWIYRLTKNEKIRHIVGHHFDGNGAAADRIACDKYACYTVLNAGGIPAVVHEIVFDPVTRFGWMGEEGVWQKAFEWYATFDKKVVVKPNNGWQGRDVYLCETPAQAEQALSAIFRQESSACICPFYNVVHEYRVFYVYGECPFAYGKKRGADSWKHNLSGGAEAFDITDTGLRNQLTELARQAAECINISFATIDIVQIESGELLVMEINAGVTARRFLHQHPQHREKIKCLFAKAIDHMFMAEQSGSAAFVYQN